MDQRYQRVNGYYHINGKRVPSVTTVLGAMADKGGLKVWKARNADHKELARKAAIRGNFMHMRILGRYSDAPMEIPTEMPEEWWPKNMVQDLDEMTKQWEELSLRIAQPCLVEHTTYAGGAFPFAGTVDMHAKVEGWDAILDLKSSKQPYESHKLQLGAYARAMREHGVNTNRGFVAYVRTSGIELVELSDDDLRDAEQQFMELIERFYQEHMTKV